MATSTGPVLLSTWGTFPILSGRMFRRRLQTGRRRLARSVYPPSFLSHPHGFTLIELLVVISIVALLLAIFMPVLARVRKQARASW